MTDEITPVQGISSDSEVGYKKPPKAHQFVKGDKRINRKGRPKSFDQLRALAQKISHEPIKDDSQITVAEAILRTMAKENPARFVEIAFGKVPDEVKHTGDPSRPVIVKATQISDDDLAALIANLTTGSSE